MKRYAPIFSFVPLVMWFIQLPPKKRYGLLFILGMGATATLPPLYIFPSGFLSFPLLYWLLQSCKHKKQAFITGWWFGFGYFVSGLYWFSYALLMEPEKFGWMVPFAVFGISGILAIYIGLVALVTFSLPLQGKGKWVGFVTLWVIGEMARGYLFTGFPWNLQGYSAAISNAMIQMASITGVYGVSFFVVALFMLPALMIRNEKGNVVKGPIATPLLTGLIIMAMVWGWGSYRLHTVPVPYHDALKIRIVQANISQYHRWDETNKTDILEQHIRLSQGTEAAGVTHIIWPESGIPYFLNRSPELRYILAPLVPSGGTLLAGGLKIEGTEQAYNLWNTFYVLDGQGRVSASYDKSHLVPFGEYVPFRHILPIENLTHGMADFSEGKGVATLRVAGFPAFSALICYEAIFPGAVADRQDRPELLINVTNDAWFGKSAAPYQHFQMARMRAVEEGLPLLRAANSGISGVVDPLGRVVTQSQLEKVEVLDVTLPRALNVPTWYSRHPYAAILGIFFGACMLMVLWRRG